MDTEKRSRRSFLNALWLGIGSLALVESIGVIFSYFRPRPESARVQEEDRIIIAGPVARFEPGSVSAFVQGKFYLARLEDGGFLAMSRRCTHLGCSVPWVEADKKFVCPCHSSSFDIRGEVIEPPAPRALDLYAVEIRNNQVIVDTSRSQKRTAFSSEQVKYPKST